MLVAEHVPFSSPTGSRKRSQHLETVPHADKFALDHVAKVHRLLPVASTVAEQANFDVSVEYAGVTVSYAGFSQSGHNPMAFKPNQDCLIMLEDPNSESLVFACLDGHGVNGHRVSQFFAHELEHRLLKHAAFASNIELAMSEVLIDIELALFEQDGAAVDFSGSTIVIAVLRGQILTIANVGDSRAVLGSRMIDPEPDDEHDHKEVCCCVVQQVTVDHKPDLPAEHARILAAGGRVFSVRYPDGMIGPPRVWLGHANAPGLAMSRSLADFMVHSAGVTSQPDFFTIDLSADSQYADRILVLGTDGLWDVMSNEEVIAACISNAQQPGLAVAALLQESRQRWLRKEKLVDDTTVCVVHIQRSTPPHSPFSPTASD